MRDAADQRLGMKQLLDATSNTVQLRSSLLFPSLTRAGVFRGTCMTNSTESCTNQSTTSSECLFHTWASLAQLKLGLPSVGWRQAHLMRSGEKDLRGKTAHCHPLCRAAKSLTPKAVCLHHLKLHNTLRVHHFSRALCPLFFYLVTT